MPLVKGESPRSMLNRMGRLELANAMAITEDVPDGPPDVAWEWYGKETERRCRYMRHRYTMQLVAGAMILLGCSGENEAFDFYYPPPGEWESRTPEQLGMDAAKLQVAVDYASDHLTEQIPEDPGAYLTSRFAGIPHQEIVGPTAPRGGVNGIVVVDRENDIVTVTRWVDGGEHVNEFIRLVLESIAEAQ